MSKDILNIIFVLITLVSVLLSFGINFRCKKIKNNYWFWSIPSLFFISYFIAFRFYDSWASFADYESKNGSIWNREQTENYWDSIVVSKALLLDMCPFVALVLPLSLVLDKSRRIAQAISPFAILGGSITIPFIATSDSHSELSFRYLLVGINPNPLYFFMHWYLVVWGTLVLSNSVNRKWINILDCHIFAAIFFGYVCFISYMTSTVWNVTGINKNDWMSPTGEYREVNNILKLGWPNVMIVSFTLAYIFVVGITSINIWWKRKQEFKTNGYIHKKIKLKPRKR